MFKLAPPDQTYSRKVEVNVPQEDGSIEQMDFTACFKLTPRSGKEMGLLDDEDFLAEVLVGWEGIQDAEGKPVPFSMENLKMLANLGFFSRAIGRAYRELDSGQPEKNSGTLPPDGPAAGQTIR